MRVRNFLAPALTALMLTVLSGHAQAAPGSILPGAGGNAALTPPLYSHRPQGPFTKVWNEQLPATSPPGTAYSQVAFDAARSQVVMFGGNTEAGYTDATWTWDASTWVSTTHPRRQHHERDMPSPTTR